MICNHLDLVKEEFFKEQYEESRFDLDEMRRINQVFDLAKRMSINNPSSFFQQI